MKQKTFTVIFLIMNSEYYQHFLLFMLHAYVHLCLCFNLTGCNSKADVTFLIDSSENIGQQNFERLKEFLSDVTGKLNIAPEKFQVSAVTFGGTASSQFYLNQFADKVSLQNAIRNIPYSGGQVKMVDAIRFASITAFSATHGGRGNVPHVAVLLTNQPSGSIDMIKLEAQTARDNGIVLYAVGIGSKADVNELMAIASDPDSRHMYTAQNFDALGSLSDLLSTKICNGKPACVCIIHVVKLK